MIGRGTQPGHVCPRRDILAHIPDDALLPDLLSN